MFDVPANALYVMIVVVALLAFATLFARVLESRNPDRDYLELRQRIRSWWWIVTLLFVGLSVNAISGVVLFGILSFLALKEFLSIVPTRQQDRRVVFLAYLSIPVQYYWVAIGWYGMFIVFVPVYVFLLLPMRMVLIGETKGFIRSAGILHWAVMLTVFGLSHLAYLLVLPVKNPEAGAIGLVLFLVILTQLNDVLQYVWGKTLGRRRILPSVSPNKTLAGFAGGALSVTLISGLIAPYLTPLGTFHGFVAGLLIGTAGFVGDVVLSSVKRDLQIKDTGQLIPGHGGILDRLDSLLYTAPLFFHFAYYLYY